VLAAYADAARRGASAYLGNGTSFDEAIGLAQAYAKQTIRTMPAAKGHQGRPFADSGAGFLKVFQPLQRLCAVPIIQPS
jgi:hypothetical protein